jgi:NAD(P)H-flavin reductase
MSELASRRRAEDTAHPMLPRPFRVRSAQWHTHDTVTLVLEPADGAPLAFAAGQFTMLGAFGKGESPISVSGDPADPGRLEQTIRDVGGVTHTLATAAPGDVLTVRGPYGRSWDAQDGAGGDLVIVAGGIGLAPLRSAILGVLARRSDYGQVTLLYGARQPAEQVFTGDLAAWAAAPGALAVAVTVDRADPGWAGPVGLVTRLIPAARFNPARTLALVCGPEVMMRFVAAGLIDSGVPASRIRVSLERNMQCGIGLCGHCQFREYFICTDGPVFSYDQVAELMALREY